MDKRTRVWLDGQCLQTASRRRGVGRYTADLFRTVAEHHRDIELVISFNAAMPESAVAARDEVSGWIQHENVHVWQGLAKGGEVAFGHDEYRRLSEAALAHHVEMLGVDVAIATSPFEGAADLAVPFLPTASLAVPAAAIFYDAIPLRFSEHYLPLPEHVGVWRRRLERLRDSVTNLCISRFTESELRELLPGVATANVSAGISASLQMPGSGKASIPVFGRPYALYVGGLDWRKNVNVVVDAFALIREDLRTRSAFVVAGDFPQDRIQALQDRWRSKGLSSKDLISIGHVSDAQLAALYQQARVVVQPSWMEGFGLVVLEAAACGAPVIASRIGAFEEILGPKGTMFDPKQPSELAALLEVMLFDETAARKLAGQQAERTKLFSWERSARIMVDALKASVGDKTKSRALSIPDTRERTLSRIANCGLPKQVVARTMANAEPEVSHERRLLIDASQVVRLDHGTGIQRVVRSICANVPSAAVDPACRRVVAAFDETWGWFEVVRGEERILAVTEGVARRRVRFSSADTIIMLDSSWEFWRQYTPSLTTARMRGAQVVSCLYDLIPLKMPAYCDPGMPGMFTDWFKAALHLSTGFVCISRAVADELLTTLSALNFPRPMKIGYWRLGADFISTRDETAGVMTGSSATRLRFLMVGTLEPRKGYSVALRAFERLWREGFDAELVIVGKRGWGVDELVRSMERHAEYGSRLIWHQGASDALLRDLYSSCDALIAASHGEGFGLPIVESGRYNKPVLASDIPVFREVGEGASTVFFRAGAPEALAQAVRDLAEATTGRTSTSLKPDRVHKWPDWAESAAELEDVVLSDRWYRIYEPRTAQSFVDRTDIGKYKMQEAVPGDQRRYSIDVLEGPTPSIAENMLGYTVRLTNLSDRLWSSTGSFGEQFGVHLGCRLADDQLVRGSIPFVLEPGCSCTIALRIPKDLASSSLSLYFGVFQDGVGWWEPAGS